MPALLRRSVPRATSRPASLGHVPYPPPTPSSVPVVPGLPLPVLALLGAVGTGEDAALEVLVGCTSLPLCSGAVRAQLVGCSL